MNKTASALLILLFVIFLIPLTLSAQNEAANNPVPNDIKEFNKINQDLGLTGQLKYNDFSIKQYLGYKNNANLFLEKKLDQYFYSLYATFLSFLGSYREALYYKDKMGADTVNYTADDLNYISSLKVQDAFETICKMSDTVRAVMINEAHTTPQTRILTTKLLQTLFDKAKIGSPHHLYLTKPLVAK